MLRRIVSEIRHYQKSGKLLTTPFGMSEFTMQRGKNSVDILGFTVLKTYSRVKDITLYKSDVHTERYPSERCCVHHPWQRCLHDEIRTILTAPHITALSVLCSTVSEGYAKVMNTVKKLLIIVIIITAILSSLKIPDRS